MIALNIVM